jgi:hypothetical protein
MNLIPRNEISSKIMTLIDEAEKELIIVSPYNNLTNWEKMQRCFREAQNKKITIEYYVRADDEPKGLNELNIFPIRVPNLHAKFYMNEKCAVVTSMNLYLYSDINSLEIGCYLDSPSEMAELRKFYEKELKKKFDDKHLSQKKQPALNAKKPFLKDALTEEIKCERVFNAFYKSIYGIANNFWKSYHTDSSFIQVCGYSNNHAERMGLWIYFDANGFVSHTEDYKNGVCQRNQNVSFEKGASAYGGYDVMFSLANVIGGLYKVSIADLYFDSFISDYVQSSLELLYAHIEQHLKIKFYDYDYRTFQELVDDIKWRLNGNHGKFPYRIKNLY